ncbi:MAG: glycosyltransferase [Ruminococcus flavefaciens]|nr:glycosyltransferase [Ruminococcus flavefaciens]
MKFTIAIICSTDHLINRCIKSIPDDIPIIVVLNFPDEYVENIVNNDSRITVYRHDERNLGLLRQIAADNCKTPAVCYLDSDCILSKGTVEAVERELDLFYAVSIPMRYEYYSISTKIISSCRRYTTPDELLFMPFAFRIDVQDLIGKLFNTNLTWGEDSDQKNRMSNANIRFIISKGMVMHKALTVREDIQSAVRLGKGAYIQEKNGLSKARSFIRDLSVLHELVSAYKCFKKAGILASLYHFFIWRPSYKYGYWKEKKNES